VVLLVGFATLAFHARGQAVRNVDAAFLSTDQYTNAFFGFSVPLPSDPPLRESSVVRSASDSTHLLLSLEGLTLSLNLKPRLTEFVIWADRASDLSSAAIQKAAGGSTKTEVKRVQISGREFWRAKWEEQDRSGKVHTVKLTTAADGYILTFLISSFDDKLTGRLERNIERITFFDPSNAREIAGPASKPYQPSPSKSSSQ
jgi:hypothetical protein